jgi:CMP-N-acetylneuraminic acid synthetase
MTTLLAIVPARMGSKRVPQKNKALVGGVPLVEYTVVALEASRAVTSILLSSDDPEILARYRERASVVTVERPADLATDESTTVDVVRHALDAWERLSGQTPDSLLVAQPTTPLRRASDIDAAFRLFVKTRSECVISACKAEGIRHPAVMYYRNADGRGSAFLNGTPAPHPKQKLASVYQRNGAIYLVATPYFRSTGRLSSDSPVIYEMPWERSINIDIHGDLVIAKALIESGMLDQEKR